MSDHASHRATDTGSDIDIAHDQEPRSTLELLQRTQAVVNQVFARFHGDQAAVADPDADAAADRTPADPGEVEYVLREQLALAGLPEQPAPWVGNTATEIAAGRHVVIDARTA